MSQREPDTTRQLACRRCDYTTEVVRSSCPKCGGDMMYAPGE